jgi:hypothetical protein
MRRNRRPNAFTKLLAEDPNGNRLEFFEPIDNG